jgi:hypothetical protein
MEATMAGNLYAYRPTRRQMSLTFEMDSALRKFEILSSKAITQYNRWVRGEPNEDLRLVSRALWAAHYITGWLSYALNVPRPRSERICRHRDELARLGAVFARDGPFHRPGTQEGGVAGMQAFVKDRMDLLLAINDVLLGSAQNYSVALEVNEDLFVSMSPIGIDVRTLQTIGSIVHRQFYPDWRRISVT